MVRRVSVSASGAPWRGEPCGSAGPWRAYVDRRRLPGREPSQNPMQLMRITEMIALVTYEQAHYTLRRSPGPSSTHPCLKRGGPAAHWAYRNTPPVELEGTLRGRSGTVRYSPDPTDYDPLCVMCHRIRDRQIAVDVWDGRGYTEDEVHAGMLEDFKELEDLREVCAK